MLDELIADGNLLQEVFLRIEPNIVAQAAWRYERSAPLAELAGWCADFVRDKWAPDYPMQFERYTYWTQQEPEKPLPVDYERHEEQVYYQTAPGLVRHGWADDPRQIAITCKLIEETIVPPAPQSTTPEGRLRVQRFPSVTWRFLRGRLAGTTWPESGRVTFIRPLDGGGALMRYVDGGEKSMDLLLDRLVDELNQYRDALLVEVPEYLQRRYLGSDGAAIHEFRNVAASVQILLACARFWWTETIHESRNLALFPSCELSSLEVEHETAGAPADESALKTGKAPSFSHTLRVALAEREASEREAASSEMTGLLSLGMTLSLEDAMVGAFGAQVEATSNWIRDGCGSSAAA